MNWPRILKKEIGENGRIDPASCNAAADWYEDHGQEQKAVNCRVKAAFWHWANDLGLTPFRNASAHLCWLWQSDPFFGASSKFVGALPSEKEQWLKAAVPDEVFLKLPADAIGDTPEDVIQDQTFMQYPTIKQAWHALFRAWRKHQKLAKKRC